MAAYVAVGTVDGFLRVYDVQAKTIIYEARINDLVGLDDFEHATDVHRIQFDPKGDFVFVTAGHGVISVPFKDVELMDDLEWAWVIRPNQDQNERVWDLFMDFNHQKAVTCSTNEIMNQIMIFGASDGWLFLERHFESAPVRCVDYSFSQKMLVAGTNTGRVIFYNNIDLSEHAHHAPLFNLFLEGQGRAVRSVAVSRYKYAPHWLFAVDYSYKFYSISVTHVTRAGADPWDVQLVGSFGPERMQGEAIQCFCDHAHTQTGEAFVLCRRWFGFYYPNSQQFRRLREVAHGRTFTSCTYRERQVYFGLDNRDVCSYRIGEGRLEAPLANFQNGSDISCMACCGPSDQGDGSESLERPTQDEHQAGGGGRGSPGPAPADGRGRGVKGPVPAGGRGIGRGRGSSDIQMTAYVAVGTVDGFLRVYDVQAKTIIYEARINDLVGLDDFEHATDVHRIQFDPKGDFVFVTAGHGVISVPFKDVELMDDLEWAWVIRPNQDQNERVWDLFMDSNHQKAVTCSTNEIMIFGASDGWLFLERHFESAPVRCVDYSFSQKMLVAGTNTGRVIFYNNIDLSEHAHHAPLFNLDVQLVGSFGPEIMQGEAIQCFCDDAHMQTGGAFVLCLRWFGFYYPNSQQFRRLREVAEGRTFTCCTYRERQVYFGLDNGDVCSYIIGERRLDAPLANFQNGSGISCMACWGPSDLGDGSGSVERLPRDECQAGGGGRDAPGPAPTDGRGRGDKGLVPAGGRGRGRGSSDFQAVVFTDIGLEIAVTFINTCHKHQPPIVFVKTGVTGVFGNVFWNFGRECTVVNVDGEEPHTDIVASISNDKPALVSCVDDVRHEFQDGDLVVFSEVRGMTELNDGKPRKIISARPYSFNLQDTSICGLYERGGIVTQVKQSKVLNFKPLEEALKDPGKLLPSDLSKFDRPPLLHLAFQALDRFIAQLVRFPVAVCEENSQKLMFIASTINESSGDGEVDDIIPKLLHQFSNGAWAVMLNPMEALFGGILGQAIMKTFSGKLHPLFQFFNCDSVESLPTELLESSDFEPINSRYDAQISVFGAKLQKKLDDAQVFVVGSGALGCEFLKNLPLMRVSCSKHGKLTVTDDNDVIEKSNLSRQFLFRNWSIGQEKSSVASLINHALHIETLQNLVGPETENVFDKNFWENLSVAVIALDNVNARTYIDQKCLYFQKPHLESGTLGAKCNTQMVIPHLTENYRASRDPPQIHTPTCTLHFFPHNIDHCLTWARSEFEGLLEKTPGEVNAYLSNTKEYTSAILNASDTQVTDKLEHVLECVNKDRCEVFQDCTKCAHFRFEDNFSSCVQQLSFMFHEDGAMSSSDPFWSAPKRFPKPLQFSTSDPSHLNFVSAAAKLGAKSFCILVADWANHPKTLAEAVDRFMVPEFQPRKGVKIETYEEANNRSASSIDDHTVINGLIMKLEMCQKNLTSWFKMNPIQFEKDDDSYHMDMIAGLANVRARNYSIPEVDNLKAKFIAGKIIPAVATSRAMVCLDLYKVLNGHKVEDYCNTSADLALPFFSIAEPGHPKCIVRHDMHWTIWDRWIFQGNPTLRELLNWISDKDLNVYSISCGSCLFDNSMFPNHKDRMDKKVEDLAREVAKLKLPPYCQHLDVVVACKDEDENDVHFPQISIYFSFLPDK